MKFFGGGFFSGFLLRLFCGHKSFFAQEGGFFLGLLGGFFLVLEAGSLALLADFFALPAGFFA